MELEWWLVGGAAPLRLVEAQYLVVVGHVPASAELLAGLGPDGATEVRVYGQIPQLLQTLVHLAHTAGRLRLYALLRNGSGHRVWTAPGWVDLVGGRFGPLGELPAGAPLPDELRRALNGSLTPSSSGAPD